jgi:hypothetical protein
MDERRRPNEVSLLAACAPVVTMSASAKGHVVPDRG